LWDFDPSWEKCGDAGRKLGKASDKLSKIMDCWEKKEIRANLKFNLGKPDQKE
jgi:hypothetical protein